MSAQRLNVTLRQPTLITGSMGVAYLEMQTDDATAVAADILVSKTAYVATGKVTGTCTFDANTTDATANAADIALGKTAYVNGLKIVGTRV